MQDREVIAPMAGKRAERRGKMERERGEATPLPWSICGRFDCGVGSEAGRLLRHGAVLTPVNNFHTF